MDVGALPAPAAGLDLTVALLWRRLRVEASFAYWFDRRAVNGDGPGGDMGLVAGALRGCDVWRRGTIEPRLCGAVEGGAIAKGIVEAHGGRVDREHRRRRERLLLHGARAARERSERADEPDPSAGR